MSYPRKLSFEEAYEAVKKQEHIPFKRKMAGAIAIPSLIAIGNPIIDITAEVDMDTIEKYDLLWGKTLFANDKNRAFFAELESSPKVTTTPGGSIQNTLRVASWCLNMDEEDKGKFKLTMLGCCGNDNYLEQIQKSMDIAGVNTLFHIVDHEGTSRCAVGINRKERTLLPDIRASKHLDKAFVEANLGEIMTHQALIIEGYFLQENYEVCKMLAELFEKSGKVVMLTLSAVFMVKTYPDRFMEMCKLANVVIGNIEECESLLPPVTEKRHRYEIFRELHKKFNKKNRILVMTAGKEGVFVSKYNYNRNELDFVLQSCANVISMDEIVPLNGAGDAFLGRFLAQYMKGKPLLLVPRQETIPQA